MFKRLCAAACVIGQLNAANAIAQTAPANMSSSLSALDIRRATLANGLRVVLSPDHSVPTIAIVVDYDVGSRDEVSGHTGFAHLFEHMMFQGSANVAKEQHDALVMNRGGTTNGTTTQDCTEYFETLPSNELALGLFLEADRMRSLHITQENFDNQRLTVMEERRQSVENRPYGLSWLRALALAYGDFFPYAHAVVGEMTDLQHARLAAVQEFWEQYYAPNNAVLAVSGDFDPDTTLAQIRERFESIPRREVRRNSLPTWTPPTSEQTETTTDHFANLSAFQVEFHIPQARTPDHYALELLARALARGHSSRLYRALVKEREMMLNVWAYTFGFRGPDILDIGGIVTHQHSGQEARRVIYDELADIAQNGLEARELERVKTQRSADFIFGLQSNLDRAQRFAQYELFWGDAEILRTELDRYLAVTNDDIKRVATTYFAPANRTILDVSPATRDAHDD